MILGILASAIRAAISGGGGETSGDPQWSKVVALLHLDGNAKDEKGGTYATTGTVNWVDGASGFGKALSLSTGDSGIVAAANSTADQVFGTGDFTVETFFTADTSNTDGQAILSHFDGAQSNYGWQLYLNPSNGRLSWYSFTQGAGGSYPITSSANLRDGVRHHVAVVRQSGILRMYVDGVSVTSDVTDTRNYGGANEVKLSVGYQAQGNGRYPFRGVIDEVRVTKMARYTANFTPATAPFPSVTVPVVYDPYWDKVALMLHGDNGVTDSSKNARTPYIVSNDVVAQTTNKKFGTAAIQSNAFSPALSYAASVDFDLAAVCTVEFWIYLPAYPSGTQYWLANNGSTYVTINNTGSISSNNMGFFPGTIPVGEWTHLAFTRDSAGVTRSFKNGKLVNTDSSSFTKQNSTTFGLFNIPERNDLPGLSAYIDEFRFTAGVARYSGDFALQTAPFPEGQPVPPPAAPADPFWDKVTVLAHLDGTLANKAKGGKVINSSSGAPTFNPNVKKFGSAAAQPTSSERMYIDGHNLPMAFTMEAWVCFPTAPSATVYPLSFAANGYIWGTLNPGGSGVLFGFQVFGSGVNVVDPIKLGQFYHVALCRDADGNVTLYWDGKPQGATIRPNPVTGTGTLSLTGDNTQIGTQPNDMLIDDFRFTEAARYAGTFTPPTTAYAESGNAPVNYVDPYWANVKSLMPLDGDFIDAASTPPLWSKVGNPVISTEQTLFGKPTLKLDGSSALVSGQNGTISGVNGSNEFTVEAWIYPTRRSGASNDYQRFISLEADGNSIMHLQRLNGAQFQIVFDASYQGGFMNLSQEPVFNAWNHVALTRKENQYRFFLNGKLLATNSSSGALPNAPWVLGAAVFAGTGIKKEFFTGYMGQFRITSGVARYLADFTPPTTAFPKAVELPADPYWNNVVLASHFDGANGDKAAKEERGATMAFGGGASLVSGQKKFGTTALTFSGLSDGLVDLPSRPAYNLYAYDFTIEMQVFWIGNAGGFISRRDGTAIGWAIQVESDGRVALRAMVGNTWSDSQLTSAVGALKKATWTHLAVTRKGNTFSLWLGGKLIQTKEIVGPMSDPSYPIRLGQATSINYNENPLSGCLDEVRITAGVSRYNAEFVPPEAPFASYGPAAGATKVTTGRRFNGSEYLKGDAQGLLLRTRTFFIDFTPEAAASSETLEVVACTDYDDYGWPYVIGTSSRSGLDTSYGKLGWYRRIAKENGQAVVGIDSNVGVIGIRQRIAFVFDAAQDLPASFNEAPRPGREVLNGTVRTANASMHLMSLSNRIGLGAGTGHEPFKGVIRAVAFWDRSLTESEINQLMTSDTYDLANFPNLSNAWLPEYVADGKLVNSASGSPMALVSNGPSDPYWANVVAMLPLTTDFSDKSTRRLVSTATGSPVIDTEEGAIGKGCLRAPSGSFLAVPTDVNVGASDFTVEFFAKVYASRGAQYDGVVSVEAAQGQDFNLFTLTLFRNAFVAMGVATWDTMNNVQTDYVDDSAWHHWALERKGSQLTLYRDGVLQRRVGISGGFTQRGPLTFLGKKADLANGVETRIQYFRFTKNVARYNGADSFTPPNTAFPQQ